MIEYNGNIYLSAYAVPRLANEDQSAGGRYEIAGVLNYLLIITSGKFPVMN